MSKEYIFTVLDLLKNCVCNQVSFKQATQKSYHDEKSRNWTIAVWQLVMAFDYKKMDLNISKVLLVKKWRCDNSG